MECDDMQKLNTREQRVYDYIAKTIRERGYAPSVRDIQDALGYKSTSTDRKSVV